ncbi:hypothetical protein BH11PSE10_BH11PSE10_09300 [soil metagenome]
MTWDARQRGMLEAMGLRVWGDAAPAPATLAEAVPAAVAPAVPPARPMTLIEPSERERQIASMDWPTLRDSVAACRACDLCDGRKQTVFAAGSPTAQWMVVGEAPGEQEDEQGEPFVGASGQLLDKMLRALGLGRDETAAAAQVYIANTLKCRPPRNRNPEPAELAQCEPYLNRQLALVQPKIILAMGRFAVQSLLRSREPVGRLRGRVHDYQGVPLIVTYHPAYLLRAPADKAGAWADLCLARDTLLALAAG